MAPDEYRVYLRGLYRRDPAVFYSWAREAHQRDLTLGGPPLLVEVLYDALVKVALAHQWNIATHPASAANGTVVTPSAAKAGTQYANASDTYEPAVP